MICAPHRARKAADSTAAADTRTLRRRYLYYITSDGCKGSWMCVQQTQLLDSSAPNDITKNVQDKRIQNYR